MKQAVILAGGKGTRLSSRLNGLPKPLIDFDGKPLLWHQLNLLQSYGFSEVLILVSHLASKIIDYLENYSEWSMKIKCIAELEPLGTAGAVLSIYDQLDPVFLVVYGDTMLDIDIDRFETFHRDSIGDISLLVHPNSHPHDSDIVEIDENCAVVRFHPYPRSQSAPLRNLVNAALYIINRESLHELRSKDVQFADFGKDALPKLLELGKKICAYNCPEYIKDCGTPERLDTAISDFKSGKIRANSLNRPQKAIFLDRDGTINEDVGHLNHESKIKLIERTSEAIRLINESEYRCIVVTNQPVVARGECSFSDIERIHNTIEMMIGIEGAFIDRIYFCPHHPDSGFENERSELKFNCDCRKPNTGLVDLAVREFNLSLSDCYFVGDSTVDVKTAKNCSMASVLVETGAAGNDKTFEVAADHVVSDLFEAVNLILNNHS